MLRFGLISDIQYADIPNGFSFNGVPRYYRASLQSLRRAVAWWKKSEVEFCVHLGDILDGFNPKDKAEEALDKVIAEFDTLTRPHYHMLGNHCLYNHPRQVLNERLRINAKDAVSYYSFNPSQTWKFIVLDGYDVSMLGWPEGHPLHEEARQILEKRNPNENKNNPTRPPNVSVKERRFVMFGGGVSAQQLEWLKSELQACRIAKQKALIFCHLPLHPETCSPTCLLWNYQEILSILRTEKGIVQATFCGHAHSDGEYTDAAGIYHRVLKGVIETPEDEDCAAIVELTANHLKLIGSGNLQSTDVEFSSQLKKPASTLKKLYDFCSREKN